MARTENLSRVDYPDRALLIKIFNLPFMNQDIPSMTPIFCGLVYSIPLVPLGSATVPEAKKKRRGKTPPGSETEVTVIPFEAPSGTMSCDW